MIRTVSVTETVVNLSGVPLPNVGTLATLIKPDGTSPLDSAGDTIDRTPIPNATNSVGVYLYDGTGTTGLIAPGDIYQNVAGSLVALPGCYWQITYLQTVRTSTSYAYTAGVINAGTWTAAVSNLGLLKVTMTDVFGNAQPITPSRGYTIALNADNVWTGGIGAGRNIPGGAGFGLSTNGTGTITAYLIRQSEFSIPLSDWVLTDTTNGTIKYFTVPTLYTGDAGVYAGGTTYALGAVVRRAVDDEPFISLTSGNVGNPLTDGAHWASYPGERITLLTVSVSPPGQQVSTTANMAHDSNVPPLIDDPTQAPVSLHDDLGNLAARVPGNRRTITTSAAISAVTDDNVFCDATAGAIAPTLPGAEARTRKLYFIKVDAAHNVTLTPDGDDLINGAATLVLTTQYQWAVLTPHDDGVNWYAQTGTGGGASLELTDGTHDLTGVSKITVSNMVVGGTAGASTLTPNTMVASGAGHAAGLVPDPGSTAGTTRYLREDATFAVPAGGTFTFVAKTANYTLTTADSGIAVDATAGAIAAIQLPTAIGATQTYAIKKVDSTANTVTITTTSSQTIDGLASLVLSVTGTGVVLGSNGANWYIVDAFVPNPLTTLHDLLVGAASGVPSRMAGPATDGTFLGQAGGVFGYFTPPGSEHEPVVLSVSAGTPDFLTVGNDIVMV